MAKEVVAERHGSAVVALFVMGSAIIFGLAAESAPDSWLSILIAMGSAIPFLLVYARLHTMHHDKDIFATIQYTIGLWPARIVVLAYAWHAFILAILVTNNFANFIQVVALEDTPQIVPNMFLIFVCAWAAKGGIEALARWSLLALRWATAISLIALFLLMPEMDFANLRPVLYGGIWPVIRGSITVFDFPFTEVVVLLFAFAEFRKRSTPYRVLLSGTIIGGIILIVASVTSIAVIGPINYQEMYFPVYIATSQINIGNFLTRLEVTVGLVFLVGGFVKVTICLIATSKALAWVFGFDEYRFLVTPIAISVIPGTVWITDGIIAMHQRAMVQWPPFDTIMQMIIPLIIWAIAEIRYRFTKSTTTDST